MFESYRLRQSYPVVDCESCNLQRHRYHVDCTVQQGGLERLLQVDLLIRFPGKEKSYKINSK